MAEVAVEVLSDKSLWWKMSRAARAVAVERFSTERVVPYYERHYESVLGRGASMRSLGAAT
jgi:glycosyltransferase involved in cell wall biosynthesis